MDFKLERLCGKERSTGPTLNLFLGEVLIKALLPLIHDLVVHIIFLRVPLTTKGGGSCGGT